MQRTLASLAAALEERSAAGRARHRPQVEARSRGATRLVVDGVERLAFCSNDYLGLADHPRVVEASIAATRRWGVGSGASHLVSGHTSEHHALEQELAAYTGRPRAVLFSTGYMANLAVLRALAGRGDLVVGDRLNHASLIDAGLASGARFRRCPHGDVGSVEARLAASGAPRKVVATDGVFSMDGDVAPLAALAAACTRQGAVLYVDDAHGFGVLGPRGRGSVEAAGLDANAVPAYMGTLGKAVGTFGAFVAGPGVLVEALVQTAREHVYTTAVPPAVAAATRAALAVMQDEPWRREHVLALAARFRTGAAGLGLALAPSATPIQPVILGREDAALTASAALLEAGIFVPAIRPPTVPAGASRLRITFSAAHDEADVDRLLEALSRLAAAGPDA
ncbi:MAG: 8-amino-7-oxononanoate synthase [Steroidobacteraceae bacterium]